MSREGDKFRLPSGIGQQTYGAMGSTGGPSTGASFAGQTEFTTLSAMISVNTLQVRESWQYLEKVAKMIGTPKDIRSLRYTIHDNRMGTSQRIAMTTQDLQRLKTLVPCGDKEKKLQAEFLEWKFTEAVQAYNTSQQYIATKMKQVLPMNEIAVHQANGNDEDGTDNSRPELPQKQIQITPDLHLENNRLVEREQEILGIETALSDVDHIMRDLSNLVNQQDEGIETIENSINAAANNVEEATEELHKAAKIQNKSRSKVLILLAIALILFLIIIGTMIWKF